MHLFYYFKYTFLLKFLEFFNNMSDSILEKSDFINQLQLYDRKLFSLFMAHRFTLRAFILKKEREIIPEYLSFFSHKKICEFLKIDYQILILYELCKECLSNLNKKTKEIGNLKENLKSFIEFYKDCNLLKLNMVHIGNYRDLFLLFFGVIDFLLADKEKRLMSRQDDSLKV